MSHLDHAQEKAINVLYMLSRLGTATWGRRPEVRKVVYSVVAEQTVEFGTRTKWLIAADC